MENKKNESFKIGGYNTAKLSEDNFFASKTKEAKLSFKLIDIVEINNSEIMKFKLNRINKVARIMKFFDEETKQPTLMFDIVDEEKKEISLKSNKMFYYASGLGSFFASHDFITQWEVAPFEKICRAFLLGDKHNFLELIDEFNLKMTISAEHYIKHELE